MTELPPGASPVDGIEPGTRLREWEIVRFVGRGSYGVVFEARRSSWLDEPPRALKIFDPIVSSAARSALLGEFSTLTDVRHPHLLAGIDAFDLVEPPFAGCVVFVLELADEDLSHRVARSGPLPPTDAASVVADVADGLAALHQEGRIHGDVKPENILRVGDRWVLGDFGVTSVLEGSYAVTHAATIDYRPPELARAVDGTRQHRSADVWALGVSLHVAATGHHPFPGPDPMMRYAAAVRGDRAQAPALDPELASIIDEGCLVPDPRRRLDAAGLAARLRALAARPLPPPPAAPEPPATVPPSGGPPRPGQQPPAPEPPATVPSSDGPPPPGQQPPAPEPPAPTATTPPPAGPAPAPPPPAGPESAGAPADVAQPAGPRGRASMASGPAGPMSVAARAGRHPVGRESPPSDGAAPAGSPTPVTGRSWFVVALAVVGTVLLTQVVAVACGALLDDVGARRVAYLVVSAGLLMAAVAGFVHRSRGVRGSGVPAPVALAASVLLAWLVSTVVLFA